MKVFVGSISHETNAFSPVATTRESFHHGEIGYRDLLSALIKRGCEVISGPSWRAAPSAPTNSIDYEHLRDEMVAQIAIRQSLDIILLSLHGAQVAAGYPDCTADIVTTVRRVVAKDVVIGVLLDLHAAVSERLFESADLVVAIKEYPHTDFPETAEQLVDLAIKLHDKQISPVTAFIPVPLFSLWHTPDRPFRDVVETARQLEKTDDVLHISLIHGFPWSDVADAGAAVLVTTNADSARAVELAEVFAQKLWAARNIDLSKYLSLEKTLGKVVSIREGLERPIVIADAADNPGAGCGGDATWLIHGLGKLPLARVAVALLHDPEALQQVLLAGEGNTVTLKLGAKSHHLAGLPLHGLFSVIKINDNAFIDAMPGYPPLSVGALARVRYRHLDIVVGAYREQVFGSRVFTEVGIDPSRQEVLVVKSAQHFYKRLSPLAGEIIYCDTPCSRTIDFTRLPFQSRRKPLWPLDKCTPSDIPAPRLFLSRNRLI